MPLHMPVETAQYRRGCQIEGERHREDETGVDRWLRLPDRNRSGLLGGYDGWYFRSARILVEISSTIFRGIGRNRSIRFPFRRLTGQFGRNSRDVRADCLYLVLLGLNLEHGTRS